MKTFYDKEFRIEDEVSKLGIYPNSVWSWIKSESNRVESDDSKFQESIHEALGIPQELDGGNWELLSKPRELRWRIQHFLLMRKFRKVVKDIIQKGRK